MKSQAEIQAKVKSIEPKLHPEADIREFVVGLSSNGRRLLRPLCADETSRARGRAEGWFDALNWILEQKEPRSSGPVI